LTPAATPLLAFRAEHAGDAESSGNRANCYCAKIASDMKRCMHPKEMEKQAAADINRIRSGEAETRFEELLDARAAVSALINATIFEHPALFNVCAGIAGYR
jgi:hypothetical protein